MKAINTTTIRHKRNGGFVYKTFDKKTGKLLFSAWQRSDAANTEGVVIKPIAKKETIKLKAPVVKEDNTAEFKKLAVEFFSKGEKALDAIVKAAKKFDMPVSASMRKYPGSFIHNYKKSVN